MLARICHPILPALALALAAPTSPAQVAVFGETWPYTSCNTVVSDPITGAMYVGLGSGVIVTQDTETPPNPELMPNVANMLEPEGLVKDLALTDKHLYIAAHRGGLARNDRDSSNPAFQWKVTGELTDTWAVTVPVRVNGVDLVFVGTNDSGTGGRVLLVWANAIADPVPAPEIKASYDVGGPVYSFATMVQNGTVTLLVGVQCGEYTTAPPPPGIPATVIGSLFRFDFPGAASVLPQSFPEPSAVWTDVDEPIGELPTPAPTFIRDIVIDPNPEAPVAYVAAFTRGLRKFNLLNGGLIEVVTGQGGWPILTGPQTSPARFDSLSFHSSGLGTFLAAALGPQFGNEQQSLGVCTQQFACDDPVAGEGRGAWEGVVLYDVSGPSPEEVHSIPVSGCAGPGCLPASPLNVAIRPVGSPPSSLRLDAACTTAGLSVVTALPPGFALQSSPGWDEADGFPISTFDDLVQIDHWLVVGYEVGVALFDLLDTPLLSDQPVSLNSEGGGVLLSAFAAEGAVPAMVFGSAQTFGVAYFQLKPEMIPPTLDFLGFGGIPLGSEGRIYAMQALPPSRTADLTTPWLITVNGGEPDTVSTGCGLKEGGGVRIWRLADTDLDGDFEPTEATQLGAYAPDLCAIDGVGLANADKGGAWFDVRVGPVSGNAFPIFVSYAPRDHGLTRHSALPLHETGAGVLALQGVFHPGAEPDDDRVEISWVGKVPALAPASVEEAAARLAYDAASGRLVVALGCNGVGSYLTGAPGVAPTLQGAWSSPTRSFLHPAFPLGSAGFVYVTDLSGAVLVFNTATMSTGPVQTVLTRRTATALLAQPTGLPGPRFLLADGVAGAHELQFLSSP